MKNISLAIINKLMKDEDGKTHYTMSLASVDKITKVCKENIKELWEQIEKCKDRETSYYLKGQVQAYKDFACLTDTDLRCLREEWENNKM